MLIGQAPGWREVETGLPFAWDAGKRLCGWLAAAEPMHAYTSEMAQNFWTAIWAFCVCFAATIAISYLTRQTKTETDLTGLVYSLTPRPREEAMPWWKTPEGLGVLVMAMVIVLNVVFW